MKIGLLDVDSKIPNLALLKIARYHVERGDSVEYYDTFAGEYDKVYASKVFTFTPDYPYYINAKEVIKGGTGYSLEEKLPEEIDRMQPLYRLDSRIDSKTAMGFLTRGCPNKCAWCVVPTKEGAIMPYMDVDEIAIEGRTNLILLDNNILAAGEYGKAQLRKIIERGYKVDFNQALDARLVTEEYADMLAQIKWIQWIRFGCDTKKQIDDCERVISMLEARGYHDYYFFYCLLHGSFEECYNRVNHWKQRNNVCAAEHRTKQFQPHCQPYIEYNNPRQVIPQWQKDLARWADNKFVFATTEFKDYAPRKGVKGEDYLKYYKVS